MIDGEANASGAMKREEMVRRFWRLFSGQRWEESKLLLHPELVVEWPQSRERFEGPDAFVDMQSAYPGNHRIEILELVASPDRIATTVYCSADTGQKAYGTSYFEFRGEWIGKIVEFWGEPYEPPQWRERFAKRF